MCAYSDAHYGGMSDEEVTECLTEIGECDKHVQENLPAGDQVSKNQASDDLRRQFNHPEPWSHIEPFSLSVWFSLPLHP